MHLGDVANNFASAPLVKIPTVWQCSNAVLLLSNDSWVSKTDRVELSSYQKIWVQFASKGKRPSSDDLARNRSIEKLTPKSTIDRDLVDLIRCMLPDNLNHHHHHLTLRQALFWYVVPPMTTWQTRQKTATGIVIRLPKITFGHCMFEQSFVTAQFSILTTHLYCPS